MKRLDSKTAWFGCLLAVFLFGAVDMMAQPANDNICDAVAITVDDPAVSMDNTDATADGPAGSCWFDTDPTQNDIWASFVVPSTGAITAQTFDTEGNDDTQLTLFTSSDGTCTGVLTEVGCNDDDATAGSLMSEMFVTGLTEGETVWLQIDGYLGIVGAFDISVVTATPPPPPPANDNCDGATVTPLTADGTVVSISGDGTGATDGIAAGAAQVYEAFSLDVCATVVMSYCVSENPPAAYFTQATDCPATIGYPVEPDTCDNGEWIVTWPLLEPGTYYYPLVADLGFMDGLEYTVTFAATEVDCTSPPVNDNICDGIELTVNGPAVTLTNEGATPDGPVGSCFDEDPGTLEADIWATFTAPAGGEVTIETILGVNNDTQVAVYSSDDGTCAGTLTEVGCNDDIDLAGGNYMSFVELTGLTAGDTYFIQIDGWGGTIGAFDIIILDPTIDLCPAPDAVICDNFDGYTLGPVDAQAAHWAPWSVGGTVSNVSDAQSFSNGQSLFIGPGGVEDNLLLLGDQTTGQWTVDWMAYVPAGMTGFFNIQASPVAGDAFIYQAYLNNGGAAGGTGSFQTLTETFTYPEDTWFPVSISVDLDAMTHSLTVDGNAVLTDAEYVANAGPQPATTLSAINFYSIDANNNHYLDDVVFDGDAGVVECPAPAAIICDNLDDYTLGPVDVQAAHWAPWSAGGTVSNVSDAQSFSNGQSLFVGPGGVEDNLLLLGDQTTGQWTVDWMAYVPAGSTGFFNIQASPVAGDAFIYQAFLNDAGAAPGAGSFQALTETFTYPEDTWFPISIAVDLDAMTHSLTVNGTAVLTDAAYVANAGPQPATTLSAINFYSIDANNNLYIDDVVFDGDPGDVQDPCPAPTAVICDNLDDYTLGPVDAQAAHWTAWDATSTASNVSANQAFSNDQSLYIGPDGADNLLLLNDETTGNWTVDWMAYIPADSTGYFNIQADPTAGNAFIYQAYFNEGGTAAGSGSFQALTETFTYPEDTWFPVSITVNLNAGTHSLSINGTAVLTDAPYVSNAGPGPVGDITLSAINFFSVDGMCALYLDDVVYDGDPTPDGVLEFTESAFTVYPNPTESMLTISGDTQIDAVVLRDVLGAIVRQMDTPLSNNVTIDVADLTDGIYFVEVRVGDVVNVSRVIKH